MLAKWYSRKGIVSKGGRWCFCPQRGRRRPKEEGALLFFCCRRVQNATPTLGAKHFSACATRGAHFGGKSIVWVYTTRRPLRKQFLFWNTISPAYCWQHIAFSIQHIVYPSIKHVEGWLRIVGRKTCKPCIVKNYKVLCFPSENKKIKTQNPKR